jgi:hypothetical protein
MQQGMCILKFCSNIRHHPPVLLTLPSHWSPVPGVAAFHVGRLVVGTEQDYATLTVLVVPNGCSVRHPLFSLCVEYEIMSRVALSSLPAHTTHLLLCESPSLALSQQK